MLILLQYFYMRTKSPSVWLYCYNFCMLILTEFVRTISLFTCGIYKLLMHSKLNPHHEVHELAEA